MRLNAINLSTNFTARKYSDKKPKDIGAYEEGYSIGFKQGILSQKKEDGIKTDYVGSKELDTIAKATNPKDISGFKRGYIRGHKAGSRAAKQHLDLEV